MCRSCRMGHGYDLFDLFDTIGGGRGYYGDGFGGDDFRSGFAPVSDRAYRAQDQAKTIFLQHLATVDVSKGPVTAEIIQFHLVADMSSAFKKFVKEHGCTATSRKLTREEQDKINKTRKSLMQYTSVKVTPEAQKAYLEKHPEKAPKNAVASGSGSAGPLTQSTGTANKLKRDANTAQLESAPIASTSAAKKVKKSAA